MALSIIEKIEKLEIEIATLCDYDNHNEKTQKTADLEKFKAVLKQKIERNFNA